MTGKPIHGNCMLCGKRIPEKEFDMWLFTFTGMCAGCEEEEQKRDLADIERRELMDIGDIRQLRG